MTVSELKILIDKVEAPESTIVVTTNYKINEEKEGAIVEVMHTDYLNGEYVEYYSGERKINDLFIIY